MRNMLSHQDCYWLCCVAVRSKFLGSGLRVCVTAVFRIVCLAGIVNTLSETLLSLIFDLDSIYCRYGFDVIQEPLPPWFFRISTEQRYFWDSSTKTTISTWKEKKWSTTCPPITLAYVSQGMIDWGIFLPTMTDFALSDAHVQQPKAQVEHQKKTEEVP